MLTHARDLTRGALDLLELIAVLCGLALFAFAAISLLLATGRYLETLQTVTGTSAEECPQRPVTRLHSFGWR